LGEDWWSSWDCGYDGLLDLYTSFFLRTIASPETLSGQNQSDES